MNCYRRISRYAIPLDLFSARSGRSVRNSSSFTLAFCSRYISRETHDPCPQSIMAALTLESASLVIPFHTLLHFGRQTNQYYLLPEFSTGLPIVFNSTSFSSKGFFLEWRKICSSINSITFDLRSVSARDRPGVPAAGISRPGLGIFASPGSRPGLAKWPGILAGTFIKLF